MKLSKSKLALAKVINENGGWKSSGMFSPQDGNGRIDFYQAEPHRIEGNGWWTCDYDDELGITPRTKTPNNWHQTCLSREEYYQAYPKADGDGWIEWKGGECPVSACAAIDLKFNDGSTQTNTDADWDWNSNTLKIIAYRLHKPEVKPELCESVMRSITEPAAKPTIEQLAQDYRNAKDYAERLQKDFGDASVKAESFAVEIRKKILELQELIG